MPLPVQAGVALGTWALAFNEPGTSIVMPMPRADGQLVTTGPYRWIRHPMHIALLLVGSGLASWRADTAAYALARAALLAVLAAKALLEERGVRTSHPAYCAGSRSFVLGV